MPLILESLVEVQGVTVTCPLPRTALAEHSVHQQVLYLREAVWAGLVPNHCEGKGKKKSCKALTDVVYFP